MDFWNSFLNLVIDAPWFLAAFTALSCALLAGILYLRRAITADDGAPAVWRITVRHALLAAVGAFLGYGLLWYIVTVVKAYGESLLPEVWFWVPAAFAGILLCCAAAWRSGWRRRVLAGVTALLVAATSTLQINAAFGLNPTLGSLLNIDTAPPLPLTLDGTDVPGPPERPLYQSWTAPAGTPHKGSNGKSPVDIPTTHSGFTARRPGLYLPPAAMVADPPPLPFVLLMMGQPGYPSTTEISEVANAMAARHHGLAPIVLVVDQLGDPNANPLCLDSVRGRVESYVIRDVVPWVKANLQVILDRNYWSVMGYSNGGVCAAYFGAKYPEIFGSFVSVSGEEFQGAEHPEETLAQVFHGDRKAYDAVKPRQVMLRRGSYPDSTAVYTAGGSDTSYLDAATKSAAIARQVGMRTDLHRVPDANHGRTALTGGLNHAFDLLYPRWGLSPPR